ncbi:ankyrin repeat-containing protein At2g01680-like isoform X1 [Aristolochia californica]|uniref:ankyrin repeat-containing protein At2g01680-like isoform X1 n=1 Tax=Aristolochia californica TaxID=171875 RepID=UPI0035D66673
MDPRPLLLVSHQVFFSAVRSGDLASVKRIVEEANDPDSITSLMSLQNEAGETGLYITADNNLEEGFSYLVRFCNLEIAALKSRLGINALHVAAKRGNLGIVKELLRLWPVLCKSCEATNTSPLYSAAVLNHLDVVNAILDADASTLRIVRKNGKTSLHTVARNDKLDMVKVLLERDPGIVSIKDKKGQTALHMAVKGKSTDVVKELLFADGSILNARDKKGNTALHIATRKWRPQMVSCLLNFESVNANAINKQNETAMDLAEKIPYGGESLDIKEALVEAGAKLARYVSQADEAMELRRTVSDIKHEVQHQLIQNAQTNRRMTGIAKEVRKLHRESVQNTTNSITVVAVLIASVAFMAIFNLPGLYVDQGKDVGMAHIADHKGFQVFCLLDATALFISLAVVVVQITLVVWETNAQKQLVSIVNKLLWAACLSICGAFLSLAFVVVGKSASWMAITITAVGGPILVGTLLGLCYFVFRQHFGNDSQRRIRRASGSKSFSCSLYSAVSDPGAYNSDTEKMDRIYAL